MEVLLGAGHRIDVTQGPHERDEIVSSVVLIRMRSDAGPDHGILHHHGVSRFVSAMRRKPSPSFDV